MGRGSSGAAKRAGGGGLKAGDITNVRDMLSDAELDPNDKRMLTNGALEASRYVEDEYGEAIEAFQLADIKNVPAIAYYDGQNIGWNTTYADMENLKQAYDESIASGFHPDRGYRSPAEAVAAHELGHALTDAVGRKMGTAGIDATATRIVNEARKQTNHRGVVQLAQKISGYATHSNAEAVAEAFADYYCNYKRGKAAPESVAIVNVMNGYLKGAR